MAVQEIGQPSLVAIWLRIEVDAVGYSDEHVAVGYAVVLGHAYTDAVASGVNHRLEVARRVDPVVDGAPGGVGCAGEHGQVVAEAVLQSKTEKSGSENEASYIVTARGAGDAVYFLTT